MVLPSITQKYRRIHGSAVFFRFRSVGVTRFELAASTSLRWRSSQTEPHPENRMYAQTTFIIIYKEVQNVNKKIKEY